MFQMISDGYPLARRLSILWLAVFSYSSVAAGYSFSITSTPEQCQNLSISVTGSGGQPPYNVLIIPSGPSPLPNDVEVRTIVEETFQNNGNSVSFQLKYPAYSQFVAVVSDSTGFGTGGTSVVAEVLESSDSSCFDANDNVSPEFVFSIVPANQIVQCSPTRIWWDPTTVQGNPTFEGVIPGGDSFSIPYSGTTVVAEEGTGFSWTPNVRGGTELILVGGDNTGMGSGGSVLLTVSSGVNVDNSCLNNNSPSSTPGSPAGGSYPTSTNGATTGGNGNTNGSGGNSGSSTTAGAAQGSSITSRGSHSNAGAIAGGVVGGVGGFVVLCTIVYFLLQYRRRRAAQAIEQRQRGVDILHGADSSDNAPRAGRLPQYYTPAPFIMPEPAARDESVASSRSPVYGQWGHSPRLSALTMTSDSPEMRSAASPGSLVDPSRKSTAGPPSLRPVNIIQHDDAGPDESVAAAEPETVELPPAYTNIKKPSQQGEPQEDQSQRQDSPASST